MPLEEITSPPSLMEAPGHPTVETLPKAPSLAQPATLGLGLKARKQLSKVLRRSGVKENELPPLLRDQVVKKSRKGKAGQIVVRNLSGVVNSPAAQLARKLENDIAGSKEDVLEKLEAAGSANRAVQQVKHLLATRPEFSLARAIAEAKADVANVLDCYAKGALALKKMETVLGLYKEMPVLMRDILRHAIDREVTCEICLGVGQVPYKAGANKLSQTCPRCQGSGKALQASDHKEFAVQKVLEMSEMLPKRGGPLVNVNQAVQVNQGGADSSVLAKLSKAADEILYGSPQPQASRVNPYVVDVEPISEGDSSNG